MRVILSDTMCVSEHLYDMACLNRAVISMGNGSLLRQQHGPCSGCCDTKLTLKTRWHGESVNTSNNFNILNYHIHSPCPIDFTICDNCT